jgi:hypothetical protein
MICYQLKFLCSTLCFCEKQYLNRDTTKFQNPNFRYRAYRNVIEFNCAYPTNSSALAPKAL